eukprot:CAMPEP_0178400976 /NCGR_PEP_ID=MMETSP0689_2-20121128/16064_1 /TAXON_ID=160604 /ORGANISM="Amphidinium massartii, Strain CS-259" /LENGTH=108 /DNA_ID=CAMNT_0020021783 /DNA_START=426 /DNA_END=752 /DNA_ORIENTATION=+
MSFSMHALAGPDLCLEDSSSTGGSPSTPSDLQVTRLRAEETLDGALRLIGLLGDVTATSHSDLSTSSSVMYGSTTAGSHWSSSSFAETHTRVRELDCLVPLAPFELTS